MKAWDALTHLDKAYTAPIAEDLPHTGRASNNLCVGFCTFSSACESGSLRKDVMCRKLISI